MATSCSKVFGIPELFEMILLALPMKDILLAQRIAKAWKHMVASSAKLQQRLYFRADGLAIPWLTKTEWTSTVFYNPLLDPLFGFSNKRCSFEIDAEGQLALHTSWEHPAASWKSMLPTQPPLSKLRALAEVYEDNDRRFGNSGFSFPTTYELVMSRAEGVKAGELVNWIKDRRETSALELDDDKKVGGVTAGFDISGSAFFKDPQGSGGQLVDL